MKALRLILPALGCLVWSLPAAACTNVFLVDGGVRLIGANLDCSNVFPRIWFVPAAGDQHGRYCYGTDENQLIAEGGVNDRGLFIGVNALNADTGWRADPMLPDWETWEGWFGTGVPDGILARCARVAEAEAVFGSYNLFTLNRVKFLVADAGGASVVVEWYDGGLRFLRRGAAGFHVATNVVESAYAGQQMSCERFRIARRMLAGDQALPATPATLDEVRAVLSATHLEFQTPTILSTVCDLVTGELAIYYFHDFEQPLRYNLREELARERHGGLVGEMVAVKPYVATVYERTRGR